MASTIVSLSNRTFGGIRRKDSCFDSNKITCSDCQNVELYFTDANAGVGLRTSKGNTSVTTSIVNGKVNELIPATEEVIEIFETTQLGNKYLIAYTIDATAGTGRLYNINLRTNTSTLLVDGLKPLRTASGCDITQGYQDVFIFSNGEDIKYIYSDTENFVLLRVEDNSNLVLSYNIGNYTYTVKGLGLKVYDKRVWIFDGKVLFYSDQENCRNFKPLDDTTKITSAGYIELVKDITAIYPYLGSLAIFHKDSSSLLAVDATTKFKISEESPGGCASHNSIVFHGVDLYFYDDTKKGVFSFKQIVNGDKTLGDNIAIDVQEELMKINSTELSRIKALSVVTEDRNEVWFLLPISNELNRSFVMIFDYLRGEWLKRKCQKINTMSIYDNDLYSAGDKIYAEYTTDLFNGEYIEHFYTCSIFNMLSDTSLKITKFPPRISVDATYRNNFWVQYVKNYDMLKRPKIKQIKSKTIKNVIKYNSGAKYNTGVIYKPNAVTQVRKLPSANFKALQIKFYTEEERQDFCIKSIEFTKIKVKQI